MINDYNNLPDAYLPIIRGFKQYLEIVSDNITDNICNIQNDYPDVYNRFTQLKGDNTEGKKRGDDTNTLFSSFDKRMTLLKDL